MERGAPPVHPLVSTQVSPWATLVTLCSPQGQAWTQHSFICPVSLYLRVRRAQFLPALDQKALLPFVQQGPSLQGPFLLLPGPAVLGAPSWDVHKGGSATILTQQAWPSSTMVLPLLGLSCPP
jgi:hypothetical protein